MLNQQQSDAVDGMVVFLETEDQSFFVLQGSAGTGKTYCIQELRQRSKGRYIYTAPTNKATKVLRETMTTDDYRPECKTIYSLLGLKLEANGEIKELSKPDEDIDLTLYDAVIVDEGSMLNKVLVKYMRQAAIDQDVKFIVMMDLAQLPPVGEAVTEIHKIADVHAELTKVMRYDNQILTLATFLRTQVEHPAPQFKREHDNNGKEGVWLCDAKEFRERILFAAEQHRFSSPKDAKAIAWRNATVDDLNRMIRSKLFDNAMSTLWLPEDRIIMLQPAKDLDGNQIASTDDEGTVLRADVDYHPLYGQFKVWRLTVQTDDNRIIALNLLHGESGVEHMRKQEDLAAKARADRRGWKAFWDFKDAFHQARHSYAITAHRSQGSTFQAVFVDWRDILMNRSRSEAFKCLYVACTRPKKELYLGG